MRRTGIILRFAILWAGTGVAHALDDHIAVVCPETKEGCDTSVGVHHWNRSSPVMR
jgi:hypothetical protein